MILAPVRKIDEDVEAPSSKGVLKPLRRRMSSKFKTREVRV
jgi:hypothetical protein